MKRDPWFRMFSGDWLTEARFLTAEEAGVLINLRTILHQAGKPIPDDPAQLARTCGLSKARFIKARDKLLDAGSIAMVDGKIWSFFIEKERDFFEEKSQSAKRSINARWGKAQQNQRRDNTDVLRSNYERNTSQSQSHIQSQKEKETRARASDPFDAWWEAYPNRAGRDGAKRAYDAALRQGADPDELMRGVEQYRLRKPAGQAWANPATWLAGRRWTDEPIAAADQPGRRQTARQRIREEFIRQEGLGSLPAHDDDGVLIDAVANRS